MSHCSFCKRPCPDDARFCAYCGSGVIHDTAVFPPQSHPAPPAPNFPPPAAPAPYAPAPAAPQHDDTPEYWQAPKKAPLPDSPPAKKHFLLKFFLALAAIVALIILFIWLL